MALSPEALVEGFRVMTDNASRRAVLTGIMENLRLDERREFKGQAAKFTLQCDIFAKLPVELATLLAQYLNFSDMIVLRRVSKRWHALLTATSVLGSAIRVHMGNDAIKSEPSPDSIDRLIKKRIRAERGVPAVVAAFPGGPSSVDHLQGSVIGYCNGVCAWIEKSTDRTSIFLIHLSSGKISKLTTENRESLNQIKVSDTLVSAISVRGYCHIWKIGTEEYKCFRIPSTRVSHHVCSGSKVLLSFKDSIVHFNFDSGTTRIVQTGPLILSVSADPSKDQFSIIRVHSETNEANSSLGKRPRLQSQKYSLHDDQFIPWEQHQELPIGCGNQSWPTTPQAPARTESRHPGTSSALIDSDPERAFFLTLEANDRIAVQFHRRARMTHHTYLAYSGQGSDLIYRISYEGSDNARLCIGSEYADISHVCAGTRAFRFEVDREVDLPDTPRCLGIVGDGDFVVFYSAGGEVFVWGFDEAWDPSGIPGMRVVSR